MAEKYKRSPVNKSDERGAILVLALVFLVVVSATVAVLTTWATNDLNNTTTFTSAQSQDYSVSSAMETAINSIRYTPLVGPNQTLNANPPNYCWGTSSPSTLTTNKIAVSVWCTTYQVLQSAATRTVTMYACKSTVPESTCITTPTLQAIVVYDDYPPGGSTTLTQSCTTYCGEGAELTSWDWNSVASGGGTVTNSIDVTSTPPPVASVHSTYTPVATATSGDTVVISATPTNVCAVASGIVTFISTGTCLVDFNDPGNVNFASAAQIQQSVSVGLTSNTISINSTPNNPIEGGPPYTPNVTATSGNAVVVTSETMSVCTASSNVVAFVGAGTCTLDFNDPGTTVYAAAPQVSQTFSVAVAPTAGSNIVGVPSRQDGKPDNGDALEYTYNQTMSANSLMSGFTGNSTTVYAELTRSFGSTSLIVCTTSSCHTQVNLGTVNLGDSSFNAFIGFGQTALMNATMTMSSVNGDSIVTVTLGTVVNGTISALSPTTTQTTFTWTPSASAVSTGGVGCSTGSVNELGAPALNF